MVTCKPKAITKSSRVRSKTTEETKIDSKSKKSRNLTFTLGQTFALAALSASTAAVITAFSAVYFTRNSFIDIYSDQVVSSITRSVIARQSRRQPWSYLQDSRRALMEDNRVSSSFPSKSLAFEGNEKVIVSSDSNYARTNDDGGQPGIAWLMSFPNSGTSFTIHMTREASNTTTATNYALEGEIKNNTSVSAIDGPAGNQGPWLDIIPHRHTVVPKTILTKTHCDGYCSGFSCGPEKTLQTVRSFKRGCLSGTKAVMSNSQIESVTVMYNESLVKRAIHLYRHPLDNIVARFHLLYKSWESKGDSRYTKPFPKNGLGFKRWCAWDDKQTSLLYSSFVDGSLRAKLSSIPCFNEFFRYVHWHNMANFVTHDMKLETLILHYHDYAEDYEKARDKALNFLGLKRVSFGEPFKDGKIYRSHYSVEQKRAIRSFLKEYATAETWEQLKDYDFEINEQRNLDLKKE